MIRIVKQHKDEPRPLKFAHLFKNATTVNEILKFLEKTEIATRNWLQNQGRIVRALANRDYLGDWFARITHERHSPFACIALRHCPDILPALKAQ
jgi:hypothetical protein